jgi:hypothetical protein
VSLVMRVGQLGPRESVCFRAGGVLSVDAHNKCLAFVDVLHLLRHVTYNLQVVLPAVTVVLSGRGMTSDEITAIGGTLMLLDPTNEA